MREDDEQALSRLAEAISERTPVDWEAEAAARSHLRSRLQKLRLIQAIAGAYGAQVVPSGSHARALAPAASPRQPAPDAGISDKTTPDLVTADERGTPVPSRWGPLEIRALLGRGGFGEVYRAYDPVLDREVALKLWRASHASNEPALEHILNEGRRLARVRHPNVLRVHGAEGHDARVGLWTDLVKGRTLETLLTEQGTFGDAQAALIGIDICKALAAVHAAGLVHQDLKTSNVMQEQGGRIVLMDFGSVTERPREGARAGGDPVSGTPLYMAPELLRGDKPATPASDIYSLGVLLFRLVSGRYPVEAETWADLLDRHRRHETLYLHDLRPDLSIAFVQVVKRALDPDPERRFPSAGAMAQALAAAIGAKDSGIPGKHLAWWKRPAVWISAAAAFSLVAVLAYVIGQIIFPGPLEVEASLFRMREGVEERLRYGSRIAPGDGLFMEIDSREGIFVYVLNEDAAGDTFVLFPVGLDLANPLPPGRHRLPGRRAGTPVLWQVTSPGAHETLLTIASRKPLQELEAIVSRIPRVEWGRTVTYAPVTPESLERLRGVGGLAAPEVGTSPFAGSRLAELADALGARARGRGGIWALLIELENPV